MTGNTMGDKCNFCQKPWVGHGQTACGPTTVDLMKDMFEQAVEEQNDPTAYRDFYRAWKHHNDLFDTVGLTQKDWIDADIIFDEAMARCEQLESRSQEIPGTVVEAVAIPDNDRIIELLEKILAAMPLGPWVT